MYKEPGARDAARARVINGDEIFNICKVSVSTSVFSRDDFLPATPPRALVFSRGRSVATRCVNERSRDERNIAVRKGKKG